MPTKDPIRIVVIGNSFASSVQLPALRWVGGNVVTGLAGHDIAKARRVAGEHGIERAPSDWRELLSPAPDLVLVTTPVDLHFEMAKSALAAGAAVLCEKPFTLDGGQAQQLVEAARTAAEYGRGAWIDHELRWSPHVREMKRLVDEGYLGQTWHAETSFYLPTDSYKARPWRWWSQRERGGGILGALGSHLIDLLRFLVGDVREVSCELSTFLNERPDSAGVPRTVTSDDHAELRLAFQNGARGAITTSIAVPSERMFHVQLVGSDAVLRLDEGLVLWAGRYGEPLQVVDVKPELPTNAQYGMPEYGIFSRCLPLFLREVVAAVSEGKSHIDGAATFEDGLAVQRVLDASLRSAAAGGATTSC